MRRESYRAKLIALVYPGALSLLTVVTILLLMPLASDGIVMQWSGDTPSRHAPTAELLFAPVIALAFSILIWALAPAAKARDARLGVTIGNGVNAGLNVCAVTLLVGQLVGPTTGALPIIALVILLLTGTIAAVTTYLLTRTGLA